MRLAAVRRDPSGKAKVVVIVAIILSEASIADFQRVADAAEAVGGGANIVTPEQAAADLKPLATVEVSLPFDLGFDEARSHQAVHQLVFQRINFIERGGPSAATLEVAT